MAPPELVDFSVNMMGDEVVKKHQKARKSTKVLKFFARQVEEKHQKAPKSTVPKCLIGDDLECVIAMGTPKMEVCWRD